MRCCRLSLLKINQHEEFMSTQCYLKQCVDNKPSEHMMNVNFLQRH